MVSIWPWKGDVDSPASFEKTLSTLSAKITKATSRLENFRQQSRRYNILWVFYSTIVYLLYSIILVLVVGWRNWGLLEIGAVALGPILIYLVRLGFVSYYNFRISKTQAQLDELQKQRDTAIERLKTATKYNTTQELLQKYGGAPSPKTKSGGVSQGKPNATKGISAAPQAGRTGLLPPPTANISKNTGPASILNTGHGSASGSRSSLGLPSSISAAPSPASWQAPPPTQAETAEFAPNAFSAVPQYAQSSKGSRWFDRLMDVILGEDESLPSNRIALICKQCRLVNGQAPPGTKRLEEVGSWRCAECGTMNGEETEMKKIIAGLKEDINPQVETNSPKEKDLGKSMKREIEGKAVDAGGSDEGDITQYSDASDHDTKATATVEIPEEPHSTTAEPPRRRVGRPKGSKTKNN